VRDTTVDKSRELKIDINLDIWKLGILAFLLRGKKYHR
jgi:hypothetical protein